MTQSASDQDPISKAWFDQYKDLPHDPRMDEHEQWCWRHWAPCPIYGANGIQASVMVMQKFAESLPSNTRYLDANRLMSERGRLCCWLGDEAMYRIWGECGP